MTDRSLPRDMAAHARRAAGQPEPGLREELRRAMADADGYDPDGLEAHEYQHFADTALAVVQPLLDAKRDEVDALRTQLDALIEACDAEYAPPPDARPAGLPALLDFVANNMPPMSPEEELAGYKRQAAWSHYMAVKFNSRVGGLRTEAASLRAIARTTAATLRDTAERVEQQRTVDAASLRAQARALDEITGGAT